MGGPLKKWMYNTLICVFAAVFLVSGIMLARYLADSKAQSDQYDDLAGSDNVTLYGHYMNDGSMFAPLGKYKKKSYWESIPPSPLIH